MPRKLTQSEKDTNKVKRIIKDVVAILNNSTGRPPRQLWAILSALRGPDNDSWGLKQHTTAKIRHAIGIGECNAVGVDSAPTNGVIPSSVDLLTPREGLSPESIRVRSTILNLTIATLRKHSTNWDTSHVRILSRLSNA
jgi:hypothetical protein